MPLSAREFMRILLEIGERVENEQHRLSELDRAIGDGDHGVSMAIGWRAIRDKIKELEHEEDIGAILQVLSKTFLNAVGASVGPLYGMAFLKGGAVLKGKTSLSERDIVEFWAAAVDGIRQLGKAELGDKTMLDAWIPIVNSLRSSMESGDDWLNTLDQAVRAGEAGMESTKQLLSQKGRSGRLGDRSIGHIDPGAASAHLIFSSFVDAYKRLKGMNIG